MSQSAEKCSVGINRNGGYWCAACGDLPKGPCEHWPMRELIERVRQESASAALERAAQLSEGMLGADPKQVAAAIRALAEAE